MPAIHHRTFALLALLLISPLTAATTAPEAVAAARALFESRNDAEARRAFEAIAQSDPSNPEAPHFLGRLALRQNDPASAVTWLEKAASLAPNHAETQRLLGDAYGMQAQKAGVLSKFGWARKCVACYERATQLDPKDPANHYSLFEYYRQAPAIVGGGKDKALVEAAALKQLDPAQGALAYASLYQSEKKYAAALEEYTAYLQSKPDDFYINYLVGKLADTTGVGRERGLVALRHCLELPPLAPPAAPKHQHAYWRIGNILKAQGDLTGARAAYEASLKVDPNFGNARDALKELAGAAAHSG
jgi:tetratricopeptide (TPR) repeat protein